MFMTSKKLAIIIGTIFVVSFAVCIEEMPPISTYAPISEPRITVSPFLEVIKLG